MAALISIQMRILIVFAVFCLFRPVWAESLSTGSGSLNTGSMGSKLIARPIPGSQILQTTFDFQKSGPTDFLVQEILRLEKIVGPNQSKNRVQSKANEIKKLISGVLDLDRLAQRALISYWNELAKSQAGRQQREKYRKLFKSLVEENYLEKAQTYVSGRYQIPLTSEVKLSDRTVITGEIKKTDVNLKVEFHVVQLPTAKPGAQRFKLIDIKLDETSLEATYRSSFNRIIRQNGGIKEGFPELLRVMDKRLADLKKGEATRL